jgi:hypothetical protein
MVAVALVRWRLVFTASPLAIISPRSLIERSSLTYASQFVLMASWWRERVVTTGTE